MDKRGQIYLVSALIIVFILYIILTPSNIIKKTTESSNFEDISKNFDRESSRFMNILIGKKQAVYDSFLNFTILFTSYSKTKNPDFGLIYTFAYDNKLYFGNYAADRATFEAGTQKTIIDGCLSNIQTSFSAAGLQLSIPNVNLGVFKQCLKEVPTPPGFTDTIMITIEELNTNSTTKFTTEISPNNPDIVIISKEKKGNTRRIYTKGKFI